ncbi:MAG: glycosyltransferase [Saprospiraceae bacterium]
MTLKYYKEDPLLTHIIINLLSLSFVYQCLIWIFVYIKADHQKKPVKWDINFTPVSIIVCSRNNLEELNKNLHTLLNQIYPEFEVIVLNDGSDLNTQKFISSLQKLHSNLRIINHIKTSPGKKLALQEGILASQHNWILLTDADCRPASEFWIQSMMKSRQKNTLIVLGYAPYSKTKGLLNLFIQFEAKLNAIQYLSAATMGFPYMGIGRNLMYHKSIFNLDKMKLSHASGDDDLLINAQSNKYNTECCLDQEAFVYTTAETSWTDYFTQRTRHYSASKYYSPFSKFYLTLNILSLIFLYTSLIFLLFQSIYILTLVCYITHITIACLVLSKLNKTFSNKDIILNYVILEIIYLLFILFQLPFLFTNKKSW